MLKRLGLILVLSFAFCKISAYDVMLIPTLMVNLEDQVNFVMPERGVYIHSAKEVEPGQPFHLKLALRLKEPANRPLKISGTLLRRAPGGSTGSVFNDRVLFELPAGAKGVFFSKISVTAHFASDDAEGSYEWILHYSGGEKSGRAISTLRLSGAISDLSAMDAAGFNHFFSTYYQQPAPERLLAALNFFLTSGETVMRAKKRDFDPRHILHGFAQAFKLNPQFHDELARATAGCQEKHRLYYALIFAGLGKESVMAQKEIIDPLVQVQIGEFAGRNPLSFSSVKSPAHLDMLWMEFFITGKFEPIRRIAAELRKRMGMSLAQAQAKLKAGEKLSADEKKLLGELLIQYAADWSLTSNLKQGNPLIGFYLESIIRKKLIGDDGYTGGRIAAILIKAKSSPRSKK